ncbi:N-acetyltransferase family 8 member 3-like [Vespula maculifrons]|uniref:N-acetyltransferase family 8 member 3-like n=1 Tax=Vespula maculifrons TaxID=7453 RepID=A0ABD2CXT3_VESMC
MTNFIVVRPYRRRDEPFCKTLLKNGIMENINRTFFGLILKDVTLNITISVLSILFLLLGFPILSCIISIFIKAFLIYILTYINFWITAKKIEKEVSEIPRIYTSDNSSYFWIAEVYEDYLINRRTIALCKSTRLQDSGWIKRLTVHKNYRRKGIGTNLVNVALEFGSQQGYRRINVMISDHRKAARELFNKKDFEIYLYRKRSLHGTSVILLFVELTYRLKYNDNDAELLATDPFYTQAH